MHHEHIGKHHKGCSWDGARARVRCRNTSQWSPSVVQVRASVCTARWGGSQGRMNLWGRLRHRQGVSLGASGGRVCVSGGRVGGAG